MFLIYSLKVIILYLKENLVPVSTRQADLSPSVEILWYGSSSLFQDIASSTETESDFIKCPPIDSASG